LDLGIAYVYLLNTVCFLLSGLRKAVMVGSQKASYAFGSHKGDSKAFGETALVRRSVLDKIFQEMLAIRYRLDDIEKSFAGWSPQPLSVSEEELLQLPDHLRRTYLTVASRGECDATVVSNLTGRCRAVESNYLNQLARMGWLNKRRVSKTINFRPIAERIGKSIRIPRVAKIRMG
jgi:hypothetical protein